MSNRSGRHHASRSVRAKRGESRAHSVSSFVRHLQDGQRDPKAATADEPTSPSATATQRPASTSRPATKDSARRSRSWSTTPARCGKGRRRQRGRSIQVARQALEEMLASTDSFAAKQPGFPIKVGLYYFSSRRPSAGAGASLRRRGASRRARVDARARRRYGDRPGDGRRARRALRVGNHSQVHPRRHRRREHRRPSAARGRAGNRGAQRRCRADVLRRVRRRREEIRVLA